MVAKSILVLFFLCWNVGIGQVQFQLQRITPCDSLAYIEKEIYFLEDAEGDESYSNIESDTVTLPHPGKYIVKRVTEPELEDYIINLTEGLTIETSNDPKIMLRSPWTMHPDFIYYICGKPGDGYQEDFYPDGKIKIRGTFKDGAIVDSLAEYYPNGSRKRNIIYNNNGAHITTYNNLNKKESYYWSAKRGYMGYRSRRRTVYFEDGNINFVISDIDHIIKEEEYYPNRYLKTKQKKNKRIEYFNSGNIKTIYSWKTIKKFRNINREENVNNYNYFFKISIKSYDEKGSLVNKECQEESSKNYPQPSIAYKDQNLWSK